jgi:ubiquinone/menaquinone biosynthesis C-methylase UbiE
VNARNGDRLLTAYDVVAPSFDRHRAMPAGVPEAIRAAILETVHVSSPRLLDLGAGSGRIGAPFVAAGDDYVGVDLSAGMLREFAERSADRARLVQADGAGLPFRDAAFDAVLLVQVFGGLRGWRKFIAEARRVLRPGGALILGRTDMPPDGLDARMKERLAAILNELDAGQDRANARGEIEQSLASAARRHDSVTAAAWTATRTPQGFIERHGSGARFSQLAAPVKAQAMRELSAWAAAAFGSLDRVFSEPHSFKLQVFRFENGNR